MLSLLVSSGAHYCYACFCTDLYNIFLFERQSSGPFLKEQLLYVSCCLKDFWRESFYHQGSISKKLIAIIWRFKLAKDDRLSRLMTRPPLHNNITLFGHYSFGHVTNTHNTIFIKFSHLRPYPNF